MTNNGGITDCMCILVCVIQMTAVIIALVIKMYKFLILANLGFLAPNHFKLFSFSIF